MSMLSEMSEAVKSRIAAPIAGTFTLIWLTINWRVPVYLFTGSIDPETRIEMVGAYFTMAGHWPAIVWPVLATSTYLVCVPWLADRYERIPRHFQAKKQFRDQDIEIGLQEQRSFGSDLRYLCSHLISQHEVYLNVIKQIEKDIRTRSDSQSLIDLKANIQSTLAEHQNVILQLPRTPSEHISSVLAYTKKWRDWY